MTMPAMIEITIPRLGWSMDEGTFSAWLKQDGDWIEKGDLLFVLESDKASQEIESFETGVLRIGPTGPQAGETVKVGQVIGYLTARDEVPDFKAALAKSSHEPARDDAPPVAVFAEPKHAGRAPASSTEASKVIASPRARRAARERGVNWQELSGTGRGGRIRECDVLSAAVSPATQPAGPSFSTVRRTIAERMLASVRSTAPVTLTTRVNAANLVSLREHRKAASPESAPTLADIVVKLAAQALAEHPGLNARWHDNQVQMNKEINIGIAVDTAAGLMVPVIHDVPSLSLEELSAVSRSLVERARDHRLKPEEMHGGTFTVTNLGMYGIDAFTPIINSPQAAILGLGAVRREAIVLDDGSLIAGRILTLSLTFDHRVIDGAPAARFLQLVGRLIENPPAALVGSCKDA